MDLGRSLSSFSNPGTVRDRWSRSRQGTTGAKGIWFRWPASRQGHSYSGAGTLATPSSNEMHSAGITGTREVSEWRVRRVEARTRNGRKWKARNHAVPARGALVRLLGWMVVAGAVQGPRLSQRRPIPLPGSQLPGSPPLLQQQHFSSSNQQRFQFQSPVVDHARNPRQRFCDPTTSFPFSLLFAPRLVQVLQGTPSEMPS